MVASEFISDAAIRFKLGRAPPMSNSLGGARPSLNRMAASNINLDAAIRSNFSGSVDRCSTRPVRPVNAGRVPALTGQKRPFEHRCVQPVIGLACPTGLEEHRSNPAKPITG
ncbi:hypothetical protein PCASD_10587 [Puccinia coronata f. sp. avenae]|uniref:Uncharacterized protein n=1 Tax=Puccinia coronata f. sp. avenae TaxID=200324 RepID=A0A2N5RW05_9BASI|nr:hypothetical protein PCASD_26076 [Puccinia coronata f. sp. avenae]PLW34337.1 hypothetical protein PCASD_10587 [Puccinia coronata f. sp. avenae]